MRSGRKFGNWRSVVGVLAVGALAFGVRLEGASNSSSTASKIVGADVLSPTVSTTNATRIKIGKIPSSLPVLPVSTANPFDDEPSRLRAAGLLKGPMPLFGYNKKNPNSVAATGDPCTFDIDCEDGDPCTDDFCDIGPGDPPGAGECNNEVVDNDDIGDLNGDNCSDGLVCNGQETCQGATVHACEGTCVGGSNNGDSCVRETDCPTGGTCSNQTCQDGPNSGNTCVDNSECGSVVGVCQTPGNGNDPVACPGGQVCDENADPSAGCVPQCANDGDCDDDITCNGVDTCDTGTGLCSSAGNPCGSTAATCYEGTCNLASGTDFANSECVSDNDCGLTGACDLNGPHCFPGRCCDGKTPIKVGGKNPLFADCGTHGLCDDGTTTCTTNGQCTGIGSGNCNFGNWYQGDNGSIKNTATPTCPNYSSGIGDPGTYFVTVGPASLSPFPNDVTGNPLRKLGDDYDTGESDYIQLKYLRFAGGVTDGANGRISFEFYDENGNFVEDVFFISNQGTQSVQVVQVFALAPTLTIPPKGFIVGHVLQSFTTNVTARGEFFWLSTDDVDQGTNDPNTLYVDTDLDGTPQAVSNFLAVCNGGDRDGLQCGGSLSCPGGGTCDSVPGVLAFELEGEKTPDAPRGGCCNPDSLSCDTLLEWECNGSGGNYLGDNVPCAVCGDGPNVGQPCRTCTGGSNAGGDCLGSADCPGGTCDTNDLNCGLCDDLTTPCTAGGGECSGIGSGNCTAGTCDLNSFCGTGACCLASGACLDGETQGSCDTAGGLFEGLGTDCEPDCCVQPTLSGSDNCETAPVTVLEVPATTVCLRGPNVGDNCTTTANCAGYPCERSAVATLTGDNSTASSTFDNPDSCNLPQDAPGAELGYFEAFQVYDPSVREDDTIPCAYLLVDHCCTDPVKIPAYRVLYDSCPCGDAEFTKPNPNHIDRLADARGAPFCNLDNAWQQFGPLTGAGTPTELANGLGTYYYPIFSALGGNFDQYQFHLRAEACPDAVCCVGEDCKIVNILECQAAGGFFLAPPNRGDAVTVCGSICSTGSCCTGPGECVDNQIGGNPPDSQVDMTKTFCNNTLDGTYVGGAKCHGGTCQGGTQQGQSCGSNLDCQGGTCQGDTVDLAQPSPCPICEIQGPNNCQLFDDATTSRESDTGRPGGGVTTADDFIPLEDTITSVCTWGRYTTGDAAGSPIDCSDGYNNKFRVRVYGTDTLGLPDTDNLVAEKLITADHVVQVQVPNSASELLDGIPLFGYQLDLSGDPITGLNADGNTCYWLEITNHGNGSCGWQWTTVDTTSNDFSAIGGAGEYGNSAARNGDMAFCLSTAFQPGACGSPVGYCCDCRTGDGGVCSNTDRRACVDQKHRWRIDLTCESATGSDVCHEGPPVNDTCEVVAAGGFPDTPAGTVLFDNTCANADGINPVSSEQGSASISADIWFKYIATAEGPITISTCATGPASGGGVDTIIAAYRDPDNPTQCLCPADAAEQDTVVGWYTIPPQGVSAVHAADENCDSQLDGAGGYIVGDVSPGDCIMIRLGGFGGQGSEEGSGTMTIASAVVSVPPDPTATDAGNRYLVVDAPAESIAAAPDEVMRVRPISLDHSGTAEAVYYVGAPSEAPDENSGQPGLTFTVAPLSCVPVAHAWADEGTVAIYGAEIMPNSTYAVERALASCPSLETDDSCWSGAAMFTTHVFGDVVDPFAGGASAQPDFGDIAATVDKFLASPTAPAKYLAQLQPNIVFPDRPIDFNDISKDVDSFLAVSYEAEGFGPCLCPPAVSCGTVCSLDGQCGGGGNLCIGGQCTDPCGRCAP